MPHPIPIDYLDLGGRITGQLKREGIRTLADLRKYTEASLLDIKYFGMNAVKKVQAALDEVGAGRLEPAWAWQLNRQISTIEGACVEARRWLPPVAQRL